MLDENEKAVAMSINGEERVFDLNGSDNSFSIRGLEEGAYLKVENNIPDGEVIVFDLDTATATLKKSDDSEIQAVYTFANGLYTIAFDGGEYVGETGLFAADGNEYYAFLFYSDKIAGRSISTATTFRLSDWTKRATLCDTIRTDAPKREDTRF